LKVFKTSGSLGRRVLSKVHARIFTRQYVDNIKNLSTVSARALFTIAERGNIYLQPGTNFRQAPLQNKLNSPAWPGLARLLLLYKIAFKRASFESQ
jgi:hypothetical protein